MTDNQNFDPRQVGDELASDGTGGDAPDRFAGRCPSTTRDRSDPILGVIGVVGMARSVGLGHRAVRAGSLIGVAHHHGDRRTERQTILHAGEDLHSIRFLPLRHESALAWPPTVEVELNRIDIER